MKQYQVTGMSCAACSARVEKAVSKVPGVTSCSVSLLTNSMGVEGSAGEQAVIAAVEAAGYGASVKGAASAPAPAQSDPLADHETPALKRRLLSSLVFLALEIYTLFFALPFSDTYVQQSQGRLAYTEGVYALCRHPGVLWFAGGYLCLAGAMGSGRLWGFCLLMSGLDVAYVVLQDLWTFPRTFDNYPEYRSLAPFLIPNPASLRRCIQTLRKEVRRG